MVSWCSRAIDQFVVPLLPLPGFGPGPVFDGAIQDHSEIERSGFCFNG